MFLTNLVTLLCLVALLVECAAVVLLYVLQKRPQRIAFIRSFKKGKCVIVYITAVPLYWVGYVYGGQDLLSGLFSAISECFSLVVLKYNFKGLTAIMEDSRLFTFTIALCFLMVGLNAVLLTLSLLSQHLFEFFERMKVLWGRGDKLFIFGYSKASVDLYKSEKNRCRVIVDDLSPKDCEHLYFNKISYISTPVSEDMIKVLFTMVLRRGRRCVAVIQTDSDEKNMLLCRRFVDRMREVPAEAQAALFEGLKVFVFGDPRYETVYEDIVGDGLGCLQYCNKYRKIAMDFIDRYPLSRFMGAKQIDFDTSLVRPGVDINVLMIGFGKTNQQIFLTSVANNQFLTQGAGDPVLKPVHYHIFDRADAGNNKNFNHSYYRYKNECANLSEGEYLPLPALPAEEHYYRLDVNDVRFYTQVREAVTKGKNDANFIVIAFGSDLENIDMAQKLVEKRREWGLSDLVIFVKARTWHKEQTLLEDEGCYFIANERDAVYHIDKLLDDDIFSMARMRNAVYDIEYDLTTNTSLTVDEATVAAAYEKAHRDWYVKKSQLERESNLYACLSLRTKLNLMGLDYCEKSAAGEGLSAEEYMAIYAGDDLPQQEGKLTVAGKPVRRYTLRFPQSRRRTMAIHEHQRWNSFMISQGMVPASLRQIKEETVPDGKGGTRFTNGKNYTVRRHGNLTTFEGLIAFRQMVAARDRCEELARDVIKYDYQLLDDAHWLLDAAGFKIVRRRA